LQRPAGWCAESGDGQVATGHELRSTYRQQHAEFEHGLTHVNDMISYTGWMYQNASHSSYA